MPSLFRFLTVVGIIAGVIYGVVFSLANFVSPKPREMTVTIPLTSSSRNSRYRLLGEDELGRHPVRGCRGAMRSARRPRTSN